MTVWLAGVALVATTILVFEVLAGDADTSEVYTFTYWFVVAQEVVLFGAMGLAVAPREGAGTPLRLGSLTLVLGYNAVALGTVALFTLVLLPAGLSGPTGYYLTCAAETGLLVVLGLLLRIAGHAHAGGHVEAARGRADGELLLDHCERIRSLASAGGFDGPFLTRIAQLARTIRFSEALRGDAWVAEELRSELDRLEELVSEPAEEGRREDAASLLARTIALAGRRR